MYNYYYSSVVVHTVNRFLEKFENIRAGTHIETENGHTEIPIPSKQIANVVMYIIYLPRTEMASSRLVCMQNPHP